MLEQQVKTDKNLFLIQHHSPVNEMPDLIVDASYNSLDTVFFSSRFRGTKIIKNDSVFKIVAWQRNVARLQKMDVSLPTIVTLTMNEKRVIQDVILHNSFAGSQGLCCSYSYLQRRLDKMLKGNAFTFKNLKLMTAKNLQCFHLQEVLQGALSFLEQCGSGNQLEVDEVETITVIEQADNIKFVNIHEYSTGIFIQWELTFFDYKNRFQFGKNGELKNINDLKVSFLSKSPDTDEVFFCETIHAETNIQAIFSLLEVTKLCWQKIIKQMNLKPTAFYNTNSVPSSLIGLIIQILGTIIFSNNYNYFQHILGALQRHKGIPLCIGIMKDFEEAQIYFPDFNQNDLY